MSEITAGGAGTKKVLFWLGMLIVVIAGTLIANHFTKFNLLDLTGKKAGELKPTLNTKTNIATK